MEVMVVDVYILLGLNGKEYLIMKVTKERRIHCYKCNKIFMTFYYTIYKWIKLVTNKKTGIKFLTIKIPVLSLYNNEYSQFYFTPEILEPLDYGLILLLYIINNIF